MPLRFKDKDLILYEFLNEIHLVCPECKQRLIARNDIDSYESKLTCTHCGFHDVSENKHIELSIKANCNHCGHRIRYHQGSAKPKDLVVIRCDNCGVSHKFEPKISEYYTFEDLIESYGLWYEESFRGHRFWALNPDHLSYIENYVKAELRERHGHSGQSMLEKLPEFIKSGKNRQALLKLIDKMKKK